MANSVNYDILVFYVQLYEQTKQNNDISVKKELFKLKLESNKSRNPKLL